MISIKFFRTHARLKIFLLGLAVVIGSIGAQWYFSGDYLPLHTAKPKDTELRHELLYRFHNVNERAINSAMMICDKRNWLDWQDFTYERFVAKFQTIQNYREFQRTGDCPASFTED